MNRNERTKSFPFGVGSCVILVCELISKKINKFLKKGDIFWFSTKFFEEIYPCAYEVHPESNY